MAKGESPGEGWAWFGDPKGKGRWGIDPTSDFWGAKDKEAFSWADKAQLQRANQSSSKIAQIKASLPGWFGFSGYDEKTGVVRGYSRPSGFTGTISQGGSDTAEHYGQAGSWTFDTGSNPWHVAWTHAPDWYKAAKAKEKESPPPPTPRSYFNTSPEYQKNLADQKARMRQEKIDKISNTTHEDVKRSLLSDLYNWDLQHGQKDIAGGKHFTEEFSEKDTAAKRAQLAQKKGFQRGTLETERTNKGLTLAERLQSNLPAAFQNQPNYTAGQKVKDFATGAWDETKSLAKEFHNRKYGLGLIPELVGGTAQAGDEYIKSLAQTAGITNYTKENPMKISLDRDTRVRTAATVNEWLNKQSPERQEHFLSGGQPTVEELGQYKHGKPADNSLNYALVSKEFERKGGGDAGKSSAYYNTIHNLAGGDRDTFTGVHRGPDGKLRIGGLSDNYQFSGDKDITALNPILKPLQRTAMSIGQATGAYKDQSNENIGTYKFNQSMFSKKNQGGTGQTMQTPAHLDLSDVYKPQPSIADLTKQWGRKVFRIPSFN